MLKLLLNNFKYCWSFYRKVISICASNSNEWDLLFAHTYMIGKIALHWLFKFIALIITMLNKFILWVYISWYTEAESQESEWFKSFLDISSVHRSLKYLPQRVSGLRSMHFYFIFYIECIIISTNQWLLI